MSVFKKGDRVRHPLVADWGLGEVLADSTSTSVRVFFVGPGEKELLLSVVTPLKVTGPEAQHPVLDNLKVVNSNGKVKYESLPRVIERFLELYPGGFYGEKYLEHERNYKVKAQELAVAMLAETELANLIESEAFNEICRRAMRVANATNLIFPNEKMALKDGLGTDDRQRDFAIALNALLYSPAPFQDRFTEFSRVLGEVGAAKWTIATYYPFFVVPTDHMFIKPSVTQKAADLSAFEINYRSELNWMTYKCVLAFSEYLQQEIAALKPRDMIDVQSFLWCIAPEI